MENFLSLFIDAEAVWVYAGHSPHAAFEMAPVHSGFYFHTGIIAANDALVALIANHFADNCIAKNIQPDWIASYTAGIANGQVFASALAKKLSLRSGMIDLHKPERSFMPMANETVLIVTDDIVSGSSLAKTLVAIEATGARVEAPIMTLGNFYGKRSFQERSIEALFSRTIETWPQDNCPLCQAGLQALKTRSHWCELMVG